MAKHVAVGHSEKPQPIKQYERCESLHCAPNLATVRCDKRGINYQIQGKLVHCFIRLCGSHKATFERQGYTLVPLTPIETAAKGAVGL